MRDPRVDAEFAVRCLRSLGMPARYFSGYVLTRTLYGKERLVGADASPAWVASRCPVFG